MLDSQGFDDPIGRGFWHWDIGLSDLARQRDERNGECLSVGARSPVPSPKYPFATDVNIPRLLINKFGVPDSVQVM